MAEAAHVQSDGDLRGHVSNNFTRWFAPELPWAGLTFALVAAAGWPKKPPLIADSIAYRALALGRFNEVLGSISGRVLHPATVRVVSFALGINIDQAFFVVALVSLALLIGTVAWILRQVTGFGALVLPLLFTPLVAKEMFGLYYCQDLFYGGLLGCFFVALLKDRKQLALVMLFPLLLTRESTVLIAVVWAVVAWSESDLLVAGVCVGVMLAGFGVSRMFAALGQPNIHHTSELVFLALKAPFDSLRNLFGVVLVPPEMKGRPGFTCVPFTTVHLPEYLSYGFTRQFGICRPDPGIPLHTLTLWLSLFGIGPAALWSLLRRYGHEVLAKSPKWLKLAGISGLLYFFIAPAVSDWLERDIGYGWPLFWLATPALFKILCPWAGGTAITLLLENLAACWIPYMLVNSPSHPELFSVGGLCVALAMQAAALWTLRQADVGQAQIRRRSAGIQLPNTFAYGLSNSP